MIQFVENLQKMATALTQNKANYYWDTAMHSSLNECLGKELTIRYLDEINCIKCGSKTNKSFGQGFCYACFSNAPEAEECVLRPELCRAHEGIARDMDYATTHCLIDQYVYLSFTGNIKIGVTRSTQIPTRWIDQGATSAIIVAKTPNRYTAGLIEVALKNIFRDKTNWRKMLTDTTTDQETLLEAKGEAEDALPFDFREFITNDENATVIDYPVRQYPKKVKSITLDKMPAFTGELTGIKGQYLIFADGHVFNVRRHSGYRVEITVR